MSKVPTATAKAAQACASLCKLARTCAIVCASSPKRRVYTVEAGGAGLSPRWYEGFPIAIYLFDTVMVKSTDKEFYPATRAHVQNPIGTLV